MSNYFRPVSPPPSGVTFGDVLSTIVNRIDTCAKTISKLAEVYPTPPHQEALRVITQCQNNMFKALSPPSPQPEKEPDALYDTTSSRMSNP